MRSTELYASLCHHHSSTQYGVTAGGLELAGTFLDSLKPPEHA
jgi:hypothetical protein